MKMLNNFFNYFVYFGIKLQLGNRIRSAKMIINYDLGVVPAFSIPMRTAVVLCATSHPFLIFLPVSRYDAPKRNISQI